MIALLTARFFFAILVRALNCISKSARETVFGHLKCDTSATYESTVAFLPHLIELNSTRKKCDV